MKRLTILIGAALAFMVGYGAMAEAYPAGGVYGRAPHHGYFTDAHDTSGWEVMPQYCTGVYSYNNGSTWCNSIPNTVNSPASFIAWIEDALANGAPGGTYGDTRARTGAAFIVQTMIGSSRNRPPNAAEMNTWRNAVNQYAAAGRVSWSTGAHSFNLNSFFQGTDGSPSPNDDAFYDSFNNGLSIVFYDASGNVAYALRRQCANPVGTGNITPLPPLANFSTTGRTTVDNASPRPGDTIQFRYYVRNNGPTSTAPTPIWWAAIDSVSGAGIASNNSGVYVAGEEKNVYTENYVVPLGIAPNTQICRQTGWDPVNSSGARNGRGTPVCATVRYDFGLTPTVNVEINDGATTGSAAEVGDRVEFTYAVNNVGTTVSASTSCTVYGLSKPGYNTVPTPHDTVSDPGYVQPATGCPRVFPAGTNTTMVTETIPSVPAGSLNRTICRTLLINPATPTGGTRTAEACVAIAAKPYMRVYGGDVSAGNGFASGAGSSTCTNNPGASVVGWNRGSTNGYAGAGAQFAVLALRQINDFSTALGNAAGAPRPSGLAFANTSPSGSNFGGNFGSVRCSPDRFAEKPASAAPGNADVGRMASGSYQLTGPTTLGGTIGSNFAGAPQRVVLYVDGDVLINNNILYPASWTANNAPLFVLVARGNIYISQTVTTLNGTFIAQPTGTSAGIIYTCANTALPATAAQPTAAGFYTNCRNKLTTNGAFVARQVRLLRTNGTLSQSTASESAASGSGGEVFNFGPANWMTMPPSNDTSNDYDAITSLPPIL